jgi:hypothetical protein
MLPPDLVLAASSLSLDLGEILHVNDKSLLVAGSAAGRPVVVKYSTSTEEFWARKWAHETLVYRAFTACAPPVRVPRLLYADGRRLLVLERLDGLPLGTTRYLERPLEPAMAGAVLDTLAALGRWQPPPVLARPVFDYPERFARYHRRGYLDEADHRALSLLWDRLDAPGQFNHGDVVPGNLLLTGEPTVALLDWEFTGLYLPGFDLALLHVLAGPTNPPLRERIEDRVRSQDAQVALVVNLATVVTRELRLHTELPHAHPLRANLPWLQRTWADVRLRLHHLAGSAP